MTITRNLTHNADTVYPPDIMCQVTFATTATSGTVTQRSRSLFGANLLHAKITLQYTNFGDAEVHTYDLVISTFALPSH